MGAQGPQPEQRCFFRSRNQTPRLRNGFTQRDKSIGSPRAGGGLDFEEFFDKEYRRLGKAVYLLTGDRSEAEDVTQEAMSRAYERWERVSSMDSPAGYVYRSALNIYRKRLRRPGPINPEISPAAGTPDPAVEVEARDEILRALSGLPAKQREALVLVEWLGLDSAEAGRVLSIDAASVRGRIHRARTAIRDRLGVPDE